jgi:DNA polymerase (family 10)
MNNKQIADVFATMADILAIQGESPHRILAYRRGAETVSLLGRSLKEVWQEGELEALPGIGKILAAKIDELMRTGRLEALEKLQTQVPGGVVEMLQVPGVGPKRAAAFWKDLGIESIEALEEAAREGRLRTLPGVGAGTEEQILAGIAALRERHA